MTLPEEENFLRIVYLHYRVVTPSLKRFFDGKHPNLSADLNLATNKAILSNLHNPPPRCRRILYAHQWNTLYPRTGSPPVVSNVLDLTLMVCLLRNIPPVVGAPVPNGFDQLPLPNDISDGANIARIKHYKNFLVSHSTDGKLDMKDFSKIWKDLETAIKGLGNAQDKAGANLAKSIILDGSMKTLLSTQLVLEAKVLYLQDQMEVEQCAKVIIQTQIKSIEEQIITNELKTSQQMEENKNNMSRSLQEMQDKNHGELTQINISITNLEEHQTTLKNFQVVISDKFDILVSQNKTVIDDLKGQVESTCIEIKSYIWKLNKRIDLLEKKSGNVEQLLEAVKCCGTKQVNELREEFEYLKANRKKVPDWMIEILEQWKKEDEVFVNTRASRYVKDCLNEHVCVSVIGPSGVGKTLLVQHVALAMQKDGYIIMKVNSPKEIKDNFFVDRLSLFVVDDLCGNFTANTNRLDVWKMCLNGITTILESNASKLIVTCRLQVFQDEGFKHSDFHLFKTCICNLLEESIALTDSEKECMLSKYLGNADTNELKRLYQYDFFPLLCKLLHTKKDQSKFCLETFLEDPFSSFENEFNDLFVDCKEGKYKIIALLLLVISNNHLDKTVLSGNDVKAKNILEDILEDCCINERVRLKSLIKELDTLIGTFVSNEKGVYRTIHDKLFDFLAYYFGTKNEVTQTDFVELLIRHADEKVIEERFVIKEPGQSHDSKSKEYVITIQDDNLQLYTKRVFDDMKKPNNGMKCLWLNRNRENKTFQDSLCTIIENLQDDEISNLIETASSGFVCAMFVMDVNDFPIYFPFGIISNHVRLQKLIKRIFDDMTNSDCVVDYIVRCRCCRNETFCTALQNYMKNLSSTKIKELIKSCSTSFVHLMFVMGKEDIKFNTPYVYKRYGVVIPKDVRREYIERVFEDTARSDHVYEHIKCNRNQTHIMFRTELLHLMAQLDRLKIQHLITYASQNFIDRCLITEENTKIYFDWEDECYGVVIPTDCIQLYMIHWFDGLTKSLHIEQYFEHNRNTHTKTFQTSLLTYMELQEDKVENLIQKASNDFLKKLFVTTKKDIKHESNKEYEHYGIVLKDKYVAMYTEKLADSIIIYDNFINNMKDNRTFRQVLKYNRELGISKITELLRTASEDLFHKMITVDIENESKVVKTYSDYQYFDDVVRGVLEMKERFIKCPFSLISTYIDRMVKDWGKGHIYVVIENNNWKNQSFVKNFSHHLKQLEPSKLSYLVHIVDHECQDTALAYSCRYGNVNFAELCFNIFLHENPEQEHCKLCALFLLVVFNNKLEEKFLTDDITEANTLINAFRKTNNIKKDISAVDVKEELNTLLNETVVSKQDGIYSAIYKDLFGFLVFYFASIRHMSKILVEYATEKVIYKRLLLDNSFHQQNNFFVQLTDEELQTCIKKVFKMMKNSGKITRYTLDKGNHVNVKSITAYAKTLTNREIRTSIKEACIDFINKMFLIAGKETKDHNDEYMVPYIVIPEDSILVYIKMMFFHMAKHDCVEECLQDNRNKTNNIFHRKLIIHMREITRKEIEVLIQEASSDFINKIFVFSEDDIKDDSNWEYEHYGIVLPEDLLQMYIERVFRDIIKSVYVPVNRNNDNKTFRDTLCSHISSFSGSQFESLIETASIKFIRRMFLSTEGELGDLDTQRYENYHMCVPKQCFRPGSNTQSFEDSHASLTEDDLNTFTITTFEDINRNAALITVKSKMNIDNLQQLLSKYIDPMFTSKMIEIIVRFPKLLVEKYIRRMIAEWMKGNVHDVLENVNLNIQSFRSNFLTHLENIETSTRAKLIEMPDNFTGDSALAVSIRVGNIELVEWCIINNANTNSCNKYKEHPLDIAINQDRPDIVYSLLNSSIKANANRQSGIFLTFPLYEACKNGNDKIVSMLLMENIEVNAFSNHSSMIWETALYVACKYGQNKVVSLLLDRKANHIYINIGMFMFGKTPLYIACKRGHTQIVFLLLKHEADEVDVYQYTDKKATPLFVACKGGYTDIVLLLLARGIKAIKKSRIDGASPLWIACQEGHYDVVYTLLNHECIEIDTCMLNGMSPLFIGSFLGHTKIVKTLLRKGSDANICVKKQKIIMKILEKFEGVYRKPKIVDSNKCIEYLRKLVSENASEHVISYMYKEKEDWVFNSIFEASPLHMGSLMGHTEIVKLLVESNSHINCFSENGSTPLFLACELGHDDIVHILLSKGADPTLDRKDLKSPLTIARENGHTEIVEIIKSQIVKSSKN